MTQSVARKRLREKSSMVGEGQEYKEEDGMEIGSMRKKQIFQGVVKKFVLTKLNILIVSEFWPSVVVGLENNTSNKLWIFCKEVPKRIKDLLPDHINWIGEAEVAEKGRSGQLDVSLIQGTAAFCERVIQGFGQSLQGEKLYVIAPAERLGACKKLRAAIGKWYKLHHNDIGGVSNSRWLLGVGKQLNGNFPSLNNLCATIGLRRHFMDILKTATRGSSCEPPQKGMPEIVSLESISSSEEFYVPCVMSYTGWVKRKLTPQELGSIFDYPELYMNH